jgi:hypothetical protein
LEVFLQSGYRVERASAIDQFPWTANTEAVVKLINIGNRKPNTHVGLSLDMDEHYKIKGSK